MNYKENSGADPISMRQGYRVVGEGPERCRDDLLPADVQVVETENGGFLGRTEPNYSESTKA